MRRYLSSPPRVCWRSLSARSAAVVLGLLGCLPVSAPFVARRRDHHGHPAARAAAGLQPRRQAHRAVRRAAAHPARVRCRFPNQLFNAVLAAEDDHFFQHGGVDYRRPDSRDASATCCRARSREGGSTITMQLARNTVPHVRSRRYRRKLKSRSSSRSASSRSSPSRKSSTLYLNKIFLGQRAYGVGAAAEVYFGKTRRRSSTLAEIALIAGLPRRRRATIPSRTPTSRGSAARTCCGACARTEFIDAGRVRHAR